MLKRFRYYFLLSILVLWQSTALSQNRNSNTLSNSNLGKLQEYMEEFFKNSSQHYDSLIVACDHFIAFGNDTLVQSNIAGYLFNRFSTSKIMGHENVAVHIAKNYFLNQRLKWPGGESLTLLRFYTEFNENSLIGMRAPNLILSTLSGTDEDLYNSKTRYTILWFFSDNCNACEESLKELKIISERYSYLNLSIFAVYTGSSPKALQQYIQSNFGDFPDRESSHLYGVEWKFVYDPNGTSHYHRLYNVIATPRLYLLDYNKTIIGRNLNSESLDELLKSGREELSRLNSTAEEFVRGYVSLFDLSDTTQFSDAFAPLFKRLSSQNREMYNIVFYHLLEYIKRGYEPYHKRAALYIAQNFILPYKELWFDSSYITNVERFVLKTLSNSEGANFPLTEFYDSRSRKRDLNFSKNRYTFLYFYSPGCSVCKPFTEEIRRIHRLLKRRGVKVVSVYTGEDPDEFKNYEKQERFPWVNLYAGLGRQYELFDTYELDYVPQTYLIDREGRVVKKGINTIKLTEFLK